MNADLQTQQMELRWQASFSASCLHAADAINQGRLVDPRLAEAMDEPIRLLRQTVAAAGLPKQRFWRHLSALAGDIDNNRRLAETALRKTGAFSGAAGSLAAQVAGHIGDLEARVKDLLPDLVDEAASQGEVLRQAWAPLGSRLLRAIAQMTDARILVPSAVVILVHPAQAGGGAAHLAYNTVRIEAISENPPPTLSEVLRLAWLLSQLNLDLPLFSEQIHGDRLPHVAALAMLPAALQAAEQLDVAVLDEATMDEALAAWHLMTPPDVDAVDTMLNWWDTFLATRPRWDVGLRALDRMFG